MIAMGGRAIEKEEERWEGAGELEEGREDIALGGS